MSMCSENGILGYTNEEIKVMTHAPSNPSPVPGLLPCPFCGCKNVKEYIENMGPKFQSSTIMCKGCKVEISRSDLKAREIWNTRTPQEQTQ